MAQKHTKKQTHEHEKTHATQKVQSTEPANAIDAPILVIGALLIAVVFLGIGYYWGMHQDGMPQTITKTQETADLAGKVIIEEYSDFQCPFCQRAFPTLQQLKEKYGDNIEIRYNHFPLTFHAQAQKAAEASECARDQDKFWEYHDTLFTKGSGDGSGLYVDDLKAYAKELGLDSAKFNSCLDSNEKAALVQADFAEGQQKGVSGTPSFFINGEKLVGAQPAEAFIAVIDRKLSGDNAIPQAAEPTVPTQPTGPVEVDLENEPVKGNAQAPVTIVEFSDFECPFCQRFRTDTYDQIVKNYVDSGKVKIVYKNLPLPMHPNAQKAAEASECAYDQGKFWEYHDALFIKGVSGGVATFKQYAKDLGLDSAKFDSCLDSGAKTAEVQADLKDAQEAGLSGTPSFIINGKVVVGALPYATFDAEIQSALS